MTCDVFILIKSINGNGEVKETPVDEGKLHLREAIGSRGWWSFLLKAKVNGLFVVGRN